MARKEVGQDDPLSQVYSYYQQYADAEGRYLAEPTLQHWEEKEQAFEIFNEALLTQQQDPSH